MIFENTKLAGVVVCRPKIYYDDRGYFFESYNENDFYNAGIKCNFVQDNQSKSQYGVLRGLHYQLPPYTQAKFVRVLDGKVLDVALDLRKGSKTYGEYFSIELSSENKFGLFIPRGFAHGFVVLSKEVRFFYKCDNFYNPNFEAGIYFNDEKLNIDWKIDEKDIIVSEKDKCLPNFDEIQSPFEV